MTTVRLTVVVQDRDGNEAATTRNVAAASSVAALVGELQSFEAAVAGLTNGRIVRGSIHADIFRNAPGVPDAESNVLRQLIIVARTSQGYAMYSIPSGVIPAGCGQAVANGEQYRISPIGPGQSGSCLSELLLMLNQPGERDELGRELSIVRAGAILAR